MDPAISFTALLTSARRENTLPEIEEMLLASIISKNVEHEFYCLTLRGELLSRARFLDEAESDFSRAVGLATEYDILNKYEDVPQHGWGLCRHIRGDATQAIIHLKRALTLAEEGNHQNVRARSLLSLAGVHSVYGSTFDAVLYCRQGAIICRQEGFHILLVRGLSILSELLLKRGDYDEARRVSEESLIESRITGDPVVVAYAELRLATILLETGATTHAGKLLTSIEPTARAINTSSLFGTFKLTRAKWLVQSKEREAAAVHFQAAISVFRAMSDPRLLVNALSLYAEYDLEQSKSSAAVDTLNEAYSIAEKSGDEQGMASCCELLSKAHAALGDFEHAYTYSSQAREIEKKLAIADSGRQIHLLRIEHEVETHERNLEVAKMKTEYLERELANSTMHLAAQTELLGNFRNELRQVVREINEPITALQKIKEKLKALPCEQIDWAKFESEFTSVHPEFRAKLIEKFPGLTKQEVKMCQLARLGLKTYEMARLLCLSERTVDGHRYSLRKKLGLKPDQSLGKFLQEMK